MGWNGPRVTTMVIDSVASYYTGPNWTERTDFQFAAHHKSIDIFFGFLRIGSIWIEHPYYVKVLHIDYESLVTFICLTLGVRCLIGWAFTVYSRCCCECFLSFSNIIYPPSGQAWRYESEIQHGSTFWEWKHRMHGHSSSFFSFSTSYTIFPCCDSCRTRSLARCDSLHVPKVSYSWARAVWNKFVKVK